jgi:hypothetical protein
VRRGRVGSWERRKERTGGKEGKREEGKKKEGGREGKGGGGQRELQPGACPFV